jgi:hypothetical protein
MRAIIALVLVAALPVITAAQLPRPADLAGIARKLPSLDRFMRNRPLDSSIDDSLGPQLFLDQREAAINRQAGDMKRQPRSSNGGFLLRPGLWEGTFESYCLRPATRGPSGAQSDGYLWAPLKGPRANAVSIILRGASAHPNIPREDIQLLLWAILARTRVSEMPPKLQAAARAMLPAGEINAISVDGLQVIDVADRTNLFRSVTGPLRQVLEIESDLRYEFSRGNANYEQIERIAVLSGGAPPPSNKNAVRRGQWSRHPGGYFVRYFPDSFRNMRMQVLVPGRVKVVRDQLHRITSIEDVRGGKSEVTYNDAIAPRPHPRNSKMKAYAFKTIRLTRRGADGKPQVLEIKDRGYTFHQSRPPRRGFIAMVSDGVQWLRDLVSTPVEARRQFDWSGWGERIQDAYDRWTDYEWLRDRAEATTTEGDDSAVDDLGDTEHYEDGIEAAITGDVSDRAGWIAENQERQNEALEHAVIVINILPTESTVDDGPTVPPRDIDFGGGAAAPGSLIDQLLGTSSR